MYEVKYFGDNGEVKTDVFVPPGIDPDAFTGEMHFCVNPYASAVECAHIAGNKLVSFNEVTTGDENGILFVDDDGYVCFRDCQDISGPGVIWTLHHNGWDVFVDLLDEVNPISHADGHEFPTDDDMADAAAAYEEWLKAHQ